MSDHARVHALVRARMSAMISPTSFRSSVTRARYSHLSLQHTEFPSVDGAGATCFDLDRVERRYLLCGTVDGGVHVYDTESTSMASDGDDAVRTQALVCAIPGVELERRRVERRRRRRLLYLYPTSPHTHTPHRVRSGFQVILVCSLLAGSTPR